MEYHQRLQRLLEELEQNKDLIDRLPREEDRLFAKLVLLKKSKLLEVGSGG